MKLPKKHVQILNSATAALSEIPELSGHVHRSADLPEGILPCVLVFSAAEQEDLEPHERAALVGRLLLLWVEVWLDASTLKQDLGVASIHRALEAAEEALEPLLDQVTQVLTDRTRFDGLVGMVDEVEREIDEEEDERQVLFVGSLMFEMQVL